MKPVQVIVMMPEGDKCYEIRIADCEHIFCQFRNNQACELLHKWTGLEKLPDCPANKKEGKDGTD